ncbi:Prolipoprotein diacylglyceryl transferase [Candidatus Xiphinematobacter sp. Idaho Grape]|uniref:prolipoprotein diacylglyceryl transferase n=1 Tax=Candidatus Xiphinematobacter sp. Idaho Grape TaxID=1704307 RepID=UPI000706C759|nr:prolipoprotein diacylglyceryl transferase [Candidatus Xiphinematobacter sp. Idaho Grape]ALJ56647.1 Prolipoprotein diacylglyceryl transferase [Candidatus Xiphinematobacter sp. Idaho Grape]
MWEPLLGYYIHDLSPFFISWHGFGIRYYGLSYALGFLCAFWLYRWLAHHGYSNMQPDQVGKLIFLWCALGVLIGGRLGYLFLYEISSFLSKPWTFFAIWQGGMASHGGIAGAAIAIAIYTRKCKMSLLSTGDNMAVVAPVGIFFGRCANFVNGELFGKATEVPWAVQFPRELLYCSNPQKIRSILVQASKIRPDFSSLDTLISSVTTSSELRCFLGRILTPRHPSQLYEALLEGIVLFTVLWSLRTRFRLPDGLSAGLFFLLYASFRFLAESFREPDAPLIIGMSRGQFFSLFFIPPGIIFSLVAIFAHRYPTFFHKSS